MGQNNHDVHERKKERTCTGEGGQESKEQMHERFKASNAGPRICLSCKIRVPSKSFVLASLSMSCPKSRLVFRLSSIVTNILLGGRHTCASLFADPSLLVGSDFFIVSHIACVLILSTVIKRPRGRWLHLQLPLQLPRRPPVDSLLCLAFSCSGARCRTLAFWSVRSLLALYFSQGRIRFHHTLYTFSK